MFFSYLLSFSGLRVFLGRLLKSESHFGDMNWRSAIARTLRSRRFWIWQIAGIVIYGIPVVIRVITGDVVLPVLSWFETPWIDHYVPGNLVEKVLVQAFFPGGAGGVAIEILVSNRDGNVLLGKRKYVTRLAGALAWTGAWSLFQFWGNNLNIFIVGSTQGNLFEYWMVFPLNFAIAAFSIFTPDILGYTKKGIMKLRQRLKRKK